MHRPLSMQPMDGPRQRVVVQEVDTQDVVRELLCQGRFPLPRWHERHGDVMSHLLRVGDEQVSGGSWPENQYMAHSVLPERSSTKDRRRSTPRSISALLSCETESRIWRWDRLSDPKCAMGVQITS